MPSWINFKFDIRMYMNTLHNNYIIFNAPFVVPTPLLVAAVVLLYLIGVDDAGEMNRATIFQKHK